MNWKQNLADWFGYENFEGMDASERVIAEKAVELYQKELNEKLKNVGLSISEFSEEKSKQIAEKWKAEARDWIERESGFIQEALNGE